MDITETSKLPELPRTPRKKIEQDITPRVLDYFRKNYKGSCAIEVKVSATNSIPRSALQPHQEAALKQVRGAGLAYKIPDSGYAKKPFDAFFLSYTEAFVVACFTKKRICLCIPVNEWNGATPSSKSSYHFPL